VFTICKVLSRVSFGWDFPAWDFEFEYERAVSVSLPMCRGYFLRFHNEIVSVLVCI
jgi:hypothetical protein